MINFKLTQKGDIQKEYKAFNTKVFHAMQAGLTAVGSELTKQLQMHVQKDVYNAYTPKAYERRLEAGGLIDSSYMEVSQKAMSVELSYEPSGFNYRYPNNQYVSGDDLIRAIETGDYSWQGTEAIPERHFWNNFVDAAVGEHGWTETLLVKTMNATERDLNVIADGRIVRDGNDTMFEQQVGMDDNFVMPQWSEEDGLPY